MLRLVISNLLGLAGAAVGGVLGFYIFGWMFERGWYGLMIPGAFLGLGCSMLARHPSLARYRLRNRRSGVGPLRGGVVPTVHCR